MPFNYNADGVEPMGGFEPIPEGYYDLEIFDFKEGISKNGDPMVSVHFEVINSLQHNGKKIMFHNVTFLPKDGKGAGFALHFLKTIGEPHQGQINVVPDNWIGKKIRGYVTVNEYNGKKKNVVGNISPYSGNGKNTIEEEDPFAD